jgi:hypothetical protein
VALLVLVGVRAFGSSLTGKGESQAACVASLSCGERNSPSTDVPSRRDIVANAPVAAALPTAPAVAALTIDGVPTAAVQPVPQPAPTPVDSQKSQEPAFDDPVSKLFKGFFVDGLWGTVTDIVEIVTHPIETLKSFAELAVIVYGASQGNPGAIYQLTQIGEALWDSVSTSATEDPVRFTGRVIFEIVSFVVAPAKLLKVAKAKWLVKATKTTKVVEESSDVTRIAKKADDVAEVTEETIKRSEDLAEVAKTFEKKELLPDYVGEDVPGNPIWGTPVKYLDDAELQTKKLTVKDGKLYDANGDLFDTSKASTAHSGEGRAIFVMDEKGNIYASNVQKVGEFHHSSLAQGKPVTGAGELVVENGVVKTISNKSGHYQPTPAMNEQVFKSLETQGVDTSKVTRDVWTR